MHLFDIIMQDAAQPELKAMLGKGWEMLRRDVTSAQKFILDRSIAATADAVETAEVGRIISSCRVPFENVWIECLQADRPKFNNAPLDGARESVGAGKDEFFPAVKPKRIGLLIQCPTDSRLRFFAHLMWSFSNDFVTPCFLSLVVDLSEDRAWLNEIRLKFARQHTPLPKSKDVTEELENRIMAVPSPYHAHLIERMMRIHGYKLFGLPEMQQMLKEAMADWGHEPQYWFAVLALLNCRNVAESTTVDISGLNRARARQGRPLFAEHKILRLRLPGVQRGKIGTASNEASLQKMRGHVVRGHFKQRRTGIFWWSDFFRGDPTRRLDKTYETDLRE